jgi:hypothetical protein
MFFSAAISLANLIFSIDSRNEGPLKQQGYRTNSRNETAAAAESMGGHTISVTLWTGRRDGRK